MGWRENRLNNQQAGSGEYGCNRMLRNFQRHCDYIDVRDDICSYMYSNRGSYVPEGSPSRKKTGALYNRL